MYVNNLKNIKVTKLDGPELANVTKQILVGPAEGWEGWVMRQFNLAQGGYTPRHKHPWPHINYIVSGTGTLYLDGKDHHLEPGSVAYVPGGAEHQFKNMAQQDFNFICIVPKEGEF